MLSVWLVIHRQNVTWRLMCACVRVWFDLIYLILLVVVHTSQMSLKLLHSSRVYNFYTFSFQAIALLANNHYKLIPWLCHSFLCEKSFIYQRRACSHASIAHLNRWIERNVQTVMRSMKKFGYTHKFVKNKQNTSIRGMYHSCSNCNLLCVVIQFLHLIAPNWYLRWKENFWFTLKCVGQQECYLSKYWNSNSGKSPFDNNVRSMWRKSTPRSFFAELLP